MAVRFDTAAFVRSHGKAPRGTGQWAFVVHTPAGQETVFAPHAQSFADAKRWMAAQVRGRQVAQVEVAP